LHKTVSLLLTVHAPVSCLHLSAYAGAQHTQEQLVAARSLLQTAASPNLQILAAQRQQQQQQQWQQQQGADQPSVASASGVRPDATAAAPAAAVAAATAAAATAAASADDSSGVAAAAAAAAEADGLLQELEPQRQLKRMAVYGALTSVLMVDALTLQQKATLIAASYPWCAPRH
jgi:hypothetical protein